MREWKIVCKEHRDGVMLILREEKVVLVTLTGRNLSECRKKCMEKINLILKILETVEDKEKLQYKICNKYFQYIIDAIDENKVKF